ncbi:MbtH family protein [Tumebacillus lipolyticus]|uniref:MbtH family protein n=1 Tax=Tumebacillus lipolyticus TaxID=1280370 RepID=A0ABW5A2Y2_9BACL
MTNPFELTNGTYFVLRNQEGQHSLWPAISLVPIGWDVVFGQESRAACLEYINSNWNDLRPNSLGGSGASTGDVR